MNLAYFTTAPIILLLAMLSMGIIMLKRWKMRAYYLFVGAVSFELLPLVLYGFYLISESIYLLLLGSGFIGLLFGIIHIFRPKMEGIYRMGGIFVGGYILLSILSLIFLKEYSIYVMVVALIGFCVYFIYQYTSFIQPQALFYIMMGGFGLSLLSIAVYQLFRTEYLLIVMYLCLFVSIFVVFLLFFERIILTLQAAHYTSVTDSLTGLYNRNYFQRKVAQAIQEGKEFFVLFSDIDNFKRLNDTQGHAVGDRVLQEVASILQSVSEGVGIAGRYGGEEMVAIIYGDVNPHVLCDSFRSRVEKETIATVSVGFAIYEEGCSSHEIIKRADQAMYVAKNTGKNRVISFHSI